MTTADFLIVGAGIAGASAAYELAATSSVVVLEREPQPGYHSTGRSAALFSEIYGNAVVRALSRASRDFLIAAPRGFSEIPLLRPRGVLYIARSEQRAAVDAFRGALDVGDHTFELAAQVALEMVPVLRPECAVHCVFEPDAMDVEAAGLHQSYLKGLKQRGGHIVSDCRIESIERVSAMWTLRTQMETYTAPVLINAAGAWADEIAALAGVRAVGLQPMLRTALLIQPPSGVVIDRWPMVMDIEESFYFKPDAGKLLISPADETPSIACDAQPDEFDIAVAVDRVENATTMSIQRVTHRWAGLRSFVRDRSPVAGFDDESEGFFWLAGQGGYGFQTSPALARVVASLARQHAIPEDIARHGVTAHDLSPRRLRL